MTDSSDRDERLAILLAELMDSAQRGAPVSLDDVCAEHPDLAGELRELWGAAMIADAAGESARDSQTEDDSSSGAAAVLPLPFRFGDYELREVVGRGGMGVVYKAHQFSLKRDVAVKMLLRGGLASDSDEERFRAEAESAARLEHPQIVPVYEVGDCQGRLYFSMKYISGETLAQRLESAPPSPRESARLMALSARAIDFAHRRGVLHRDLKPSNILIDDDGEPHITDFGLAKRWNEPGTLTRTGAVLGTPAYMSPEQAGGGRVDVGPASDVYSLGSILYHLITGRPPFQAASPVDAVLKVIEQDPTPPRLIRASVDRDLELIALRCLQKPPDLRYESAGELADDLEAFLNDEPISARSGRFTQVLARMFRETHHATVLENWGLLWMWHSVVLLLVCVLTNWLHYIEDPNRWHYAGLWVLALGAWAGVFWSLRRQIGPVTFVERQIAHVWAGSMVCIAMVFPLEWWLGLEPLKLSPVLGLVSMMVFIVKAGILSGQFYFQAAALLAVTVAMAAWPKVAHLSFGAVSFLCFFIPGLKYYWQRRASESNSVEQ